MQAAEHANIEAVVPEEDSKLPAKRPRRKAALKSEERIAEMADDREQEEDVKPPAKTKRRRTTKTKGALKTEEGTALTNEASSSVTINVDAMVNVMEFLPPRSLFNVALTCKSLREMVTTKMVVHSALIHGGNAKKTMEELHKLMSCHSIHVPSPLRLLRLANGTKCEFCVNKNVNSLYEGLNIGAFSCWDCIAAKSSKKNATLDPVTKPWKTSWARYWTNPVYRKILNHPRVGFRDKSKGKYLWSKFRHDADGKKFGPIVRFQDIDAMAESKEGRSATAAAKAASSAAVGNYGASRLAEQTALANTDWNWIDQYLTDHLDAPPKEDYAEFIEAYTDITERAQRVVREKAAIKRAKKAKIEANRQVVGQQLVSDVTALIDEPFRARAMERSQYGRQAFVAPFVDNVMKPYVGAVSKIKKNTPTELAKEINSVLRGLDELLAMKFLSDEDAFETAAKAFFRECFPNVDSIMEKKWCLDTTFHDFMKQGLFFQALCSLKSYKLSPVLLASEPSASLAKSATFLSESSLRTLAGRAWDTHFAFLSKESFDSNKNTQAFQASHVYFGKVLARLGRYFKWLEAKREAAKTEEELRIWERDGDCKTKINAVVGYGYWTSNHFDFFMWQDDFEQVFKYQTDYTFRCEQNRVGGWSRA